MELKEYFQQPYQGRNSFLKNVIFPIFGKENFEEGYDEPLLENNPELSTAAVATGIAAICRIGTIELDFNPINIFDIQVSNHVQLTRNRVGVQQLVRRIMSTYSSAFMIFHYNDAEGWDWRFSFCSKRGNDNTTDSKRYTFLLGPGQSCRTATENFKKLLYKNGNIELKDIEKAFDVEALSNEFFEKYKSHYERFVQYITGKRFVKEAGKWKEKVLHEPHSTIYDAFGKNDKVVRDYIKKLLGRIVFLHFLQKKGWMGVPKDKQWGEGDLQFMMNLYKHCTEEQKENFLDEILEPLFSDGIDTPRENDLFDTGVALENGSVVKIPYLNGGLFERDTLDKVNTKFPAKFFADLLDFFYQYNFTIDENDPNDAQVGVDPEMLGRIFENLLEDNKDKGAYYTPKEIVRYMCRQSLISYLQTNIIDESHRKAIEEFVKTYNIEFLGGKDSSLAKLIDQRLCDVKICDPAIGSGAFPMGLLRELFLCRGAIEDFHNAADIKRHIIQENIYGVDYERGAVDIARLRFWLSLIVDEETPQSLPNLDYKIMQGNSLLESYRGVDLSRLAKDSRQLVSETQALELFDNMLDVYRKQLREMVASYYSEPDHTRKQKLVKKIRENVLTQIKESGLNVDFSDIDLQANSKFFLWHTWFADVLNRPSGCNGFDIVIGNPPYVEAKKLKYIANALKPQYSVYSGTADLSIYFIEQGLNLLAENGVLSYITTNKFFNTGYGKKVRKMLSTYHIGQLINFEQVEVFEDVLVSSVIIGVQKSPCSDNNNFVYERFYQLSCNDFKKEFMNRIDRLGCYSQDYLGEAEWSFANIPQLRLKEHIEQNTTLLKDIDGIHIYRGITTGFNPAFIISNEQRDLFIATDANNKQVIKNMLQGRNIRKWHYKESDENLIFIPWHFPIHEDETISGASTQAEKCLKAKFPSLYSHLLMYKTELENRNHDETGIRYEWYALQRCAASYSQEFERPEKIIWGLTANNWAFAYDDKQHYLPSNGYILTSERIPVKYLLGWLNSKLMKHYFSYIGVMTAGGAFTLKAATISVLPFKVSTNYQPIIDIVDRILCKKGRDIQSDTSDEEQMIDNLVYQLYDLTDEEILLIEGR